MDALFLSVAFGLTFGLIVLSTGLVHDFLTVAIVRRRPSVWELVTENSGD